MSKKKKLNDIQIMQVQQMLAQGASPAQVAKHFGTNKPSILKAVDMWNTEPRAIENGAQFKMVRGKVVRVSPPKETKKKEAPTPQVKEYSGEELEGMGFEVK